MSNPAVETALDLFLERLTPVAYRTAGVKPVNIDVSLSPEDLRAVGTQLLDAYDAARAEWMGEREAALAKITALEANLDRSGLEVAHLTAQLQKNTLVQPAPATTSTATPSAPEAPHG